MNQFNAIDLAIKGLTSLVAVVGAIVATFKFIEEKRKSNQTAKVEAYKPFTEKQQEVYFDLVNTTATISNRFGEPEWEIAIKHFWVLYWGVVPIVADAGVGQAVDRFAEALDDQSDWVAARNASMDLARACRTALGDAWRANLDVVPAWWQQR